MKLAIVGSRSFSDTTYLYNKVDQLIQERGLVVESIVSGGAKGVDSLASQYARDRGFQLIEYLPDYSRYGRKAPIVRNQSIIADSDFVIAFWDGKSKGTENSINVATKLGKGLYIEMISETD